jgi:hypothetical protein
MGLLARLEQRALLYTNNMVGIKLLFLPHGTTQGKMIIRKWLLYTVDFDWLGTWSPSYKRQGLFVINYGNQRI